MPYPITVCMIAKNEAANITASLTSIRPFVEEMIVVDTGSTDSTRELAERCGAKVYSFEWNDNFSDARNAAISHATQPFLFVLDADEQFDPASESALRDYCQQTEPVAGRILHKGYTDEQGTFSMGEITRLFPNRPDVRYRGRIHEQVFFGGQNPRTISTKVMITHTGYLPESIRKTKKTERNIRLLLKEAEDFPNDPYLLYQLGKTYFVDKQHEEAMRYFQTVVDLWSEKAEPLPAYAPTLLLQFAYCSLYCRDFPTLYQVVETAVDLYPDYTDLYFVYGVALVQQQDVQNLQDIREAFEYCLRLGEPDPSRYETVHGVGSFRAQYNLAVYYDMTGDSQMAKSLYQAAADEGYAPARDRLRALAN